MKLRNDWNPLMWPFLLATAAYGIGFSFILPFTFDAGSSSLFIAMNSLGHIVPIIWGLAAVCAMIGAISFLIWNQESLGKASGLLGAALWFFASGCYIATGDWLVLFSVALPNLIYWIWQYLSLSQFYSKPS